MQSSRLERPVRDSSEAHVALALVLDVSGSMSGKKISSLNEAVNTLIKQMQADNRLKNIVDLGIFVFGKEDRVHIYQGFRAMADCEKVSLRAEDDSTYVADTLEKAIELLKKRCEIYDQGSGSYKPWIVLITDGAFHDSKKRLEEVGIIIKKRESQNKLQFFGLGVDGFNRAQLEALTNNPSHVIEVKAANFVEFLSWVGRSFSVISSKEPGAAVTLEPLIFQV